MLGSVLCAALIAVVTGNSQDYYRYDDQGYMSDFNSEWAMLSGRLSHQPKCIDIPANLSLCHGIGYTQMRLPNLLEHETISEVTQQAASWRSLVNIHCHPDTKLFLCSLFSPVCLDRPIWPCRTLCEGVKAGCESRMLKYGFPWPEMFKCDKFPLDNDLCINLQNDKKPDESVCEPCNQPDTYEAIVDSYCRSSFAMKINVDEHVISSQDIKITRQKKRKLLKKGDLKKRDIKSTILYIQNGANCDCNALDREMRNQQLLVMGNKIDDRLVLTHVQNYDKRSPSIRKAMRAIRKNPDDVCKVIPVIPGRGGDGGDAEPEVMSEPEAMSVTPSNSGRRNRPSNERREKERRKENRRNDRERKRDRDERRQRKGRKDNSREDNGGRRRDQSFIDSNGGRRGRRERNNGRGNRNRDGRN